MFYHMTLVINQPITHGTHYLLNITAWEKPSHLSQTVCVLHTIKALRILQALQIYKRLNGHNTLRHIFDFSHKKDFLQIVVRNSYATSPYKLGRCTNSTYMHMFCIFFISSCIIFEFGKLC